MLNYLILAITALLYSPIFSQLYRGRWEMIDYTHAYYILPISLWLIWRTKKGTATFFSVAVSPREKKSLSPFLLLPGLLLFIFGWRWDYLSISTFSLIPVLFGLTGLLYGGQAVKTLTFPILYLLFLVPPPMGILDSVTLPMRHMISVLTEIILKFFHYPISREGLLLSIGGHQLYMGEPCSGFRSLVTMLALGLLYVYLIKSSTGKKLILVAAIVPLALLGNLIRVITLCLVTFYFGAAVAQGFFHYFSGAVIFVIMLLGLLGLESIIPSGTISVKTSYISRARKVSPFTNNLLIILLAATALLSFAVPKPIDVSPDILSRLEIPYRIGPWQGKDIAQELNLNDD
ncbi:MAG: exosortase/archaeosortase family protein, partial [Candidatus Omnitrophota bacterium]|nr:exosortase/archaeosortase family protein [Candidatus Omnitrophota bacterium]